MKMMKKPDRYVFPAVLTYEEDQEISVIFPDLDCATSGIDEADALYSARECLGGRLSLMEDMGMEIPAPSKLINLKTAANEKACLVDVYMPSIREAANNKAVNKTVTLPAWLNAKAMELGINFSQVLQDALKARIRG